MNKSRIFVIIAALTGLFSITACSNTEFTPKQSQIEQATITADTLTDTYGNTIEYVSRPEDTQGQHPNLKIINNTGSKIFDIQLVDESGTDYLCILGKVVLNDKQAIGADLFLPDSIDSTSLVLKVSGLTFSTEVTGYDFKNVAEIKINKNENGNLYTNVKIYN